MNIRIKLGVEDLIAAYLAATGEYRDRITRKSEPFKFVERMVLTDSHKFDTLIALPL